MSIILVLLLMLGAVVASAVIIVRWALARNRPPAGFPLDSTRPKPTPDNESRS